MAGSLSGIRGGPELARVSAAEWQRVNFVNQFKKTLIFLTDSHSKWQPGLIIASHCGPYFDT